MALTREQLLAGLVTINGEIDERKSSEAIAKASKAKRPNGGDRREASSTTERGGGIPDVREDVPRAEETVEEYLARREESLKRKITEYEQGIDGLVEMLKEVRSEYNGIKAALLAFKSSKK